ncbi:MAG: hotdog fold thioesterase [Flavobacteriia bacterium]|nr:hotdog fold thioesterase [Flavobacteriia bacterium]
MQTQKTPEEIVALMLEKDHYSKEMGMKVLSLGLGTCEIQLNVQKMMLNGFMIAHGAVTYALSDTALAFASNAYGQQCVSLETSISHLKPVFENDVLTGFCIEIHRGKNSGIYEVKVFNQKKELVSLFKGIVFIKNTSW